MSETMPTATPGSHPAPSHRPHSDRARRDRPARLRRSSAGVPAAAVRGMGGRTRGPGPPGLHRRLHRRDRRLRARVGAHARRGSHLRIGLGHVVYVLVGATLGASAAFLVSRYVARAAVEDRIGESPKFRSIDQAVGESGLQDRLPAEAVPGLPVQPRSTTRSGSPRCALSTTSRPRSACSPARCSTPTTARCSETWPSWPRSAPPTGTPGTTSVLLLGLVATIVVTTLVTRIARRALREATTALNPFRHWRAARALPPRSRTDRILPAATTRDP